MRKPSVAALARTHRQGSRRCGQGQNCDDGELHVAWSTSNRPWKARFVNLGTVAQRTEGTT